jgi:D-amino-acid dehydrogenase
MHVVVLGAGVVGVTSAYYLSEAGHRVTVIDREPAVAEACSFANGSQLSYSYTDAMATPSFLMKTPRLLAGLDEGIRFRPPLSFELLKWGSAFLAQCTSSKAEANTLFNLSLAMRSQQLLQDLRTQLDSDFEYRQAGKIVLLPGEQERQDAIRASALKAERGCDSRVIGLEEAISIEPAIQHMTGDYHAAVYAKGDDVGDARAFSRSLAQYLVNSGSCKFQFSTNARRIVVSGKRIRGVQTDKEMIDADAVVMCLGAWSPQLLRPLGIKPLIYPARGYSVTLQAGSQANSVSVTDIGGRFVISRIADQIRIAGFADFVGLNVSRDRRRVRQLCAVANQRAPLAADFDTRLKHEWGGFRPLTPDGRPIIGGTPINGLYLNTGHGSLGWTLACVSGELLVNSMQLEAKSSRNIARPRRADSYSAIEQEIV